MVLGIRKQCHREITYINDLKVNFFTSLFYLFIAFFFNTNTTYNYYKQYLH